MSRKRIPFELTIILVALIVQAPVIFAPSNSLMNWYSSDDAFYYFKTAQNITEGRGVTFDGIGRASGFHPLWMLVCVPVFALARLDLMLPLRVLTLISILLHAGSASLIYRMLNRMISPAASALASALWLFSPLVHHTTTQMGMESGINAFFTLGLLAQFSRCELDHDWRPKRLVELGGLATLALFSRLDNVFLVFIMGLWMLLRGNPMRYLLIMDMILAPVIALCSFYTIVGFYESLRPYFPAAQMMALVSFIVRPLTYFLFSLYGRPPNETVARTWLRMLSAVLTASLTIGVIMLCAFAAGVFNAFPRRSLLVDGILGLVAAIGLRGAYQYLRGERGLLPSEKTGQPLKFIQLHLPAWLSDGFWYALPALAALTLYLVWNKSYFGVLMPVSGQIKHWWGSIYSAYGRPVASFSEFFGFPSEIRDSPWHLALSLPMSLARASHPLLRSFSLWNEERFLVITTIILVALSVLIILNHWQHQRRVFVCLGLVPLAAACTAQMIYYNGTNYVGLRNWYWTSQIIFTVLIAGVLLDGIEHILLNLKFPKWMFNWIEYLLIGYLLVSFTRVLYQLIPLRVEELHADAYLSEVRSLEKVTKSGSLIGMTGGGVVAYFINDRTVVNLDGLMNTAEYFQLMRSGKAYEYLNRIGLDYVYGNANIITRTEPFNAIFTERVKLLYELEGGALFRYIPKP